MTSPPITYEAHPLPQESHSSFLDREAILKAYERDGFYVFRKVIDPLLLEEVHSHVQWLIRRYPALRPEHLHHPLMRDDAFWVSVVTNEKLLDIAKLILDPNLVCFTAHYIYKPAHDGHAVLWHQDGAYWKLDPLRALTLWVSLYDSKEDNGCLYMIPGSHRLALQSIRIEKQVPNMLGSELDFSSISDADRHYVDVKKAVPIELEPGDVSIHHPLVVHGSPPNRSPRSRCGLDIGYMDTATRISNAGLYMDPLLCCGAPIPGINSYRAWPDYHPEKTISFRGHEQWNERVRAVNRPEFRHPSPDDEPPYEIVKRMMHRLESGTART